jgi:hypothetical protein
MKEDYDFFRLPISQTFYSIKMSFCELQKISKIFSGITTDD